MSAEELENASQFWVSHNVISIWKMCALLTDVDEIRIKFSLSSYGSIIWWSFTWVTLVSCICWEPVLVFYVWDFSCWYWICYWGKRRLDRKGKGFDDKQINKEDCFKINVLKQFMLAPILDIRDTVKYKEVMKQYLFFWPCNDLWNLRFWKSCHF